MKNDLYKIAKARLKKDEDVFDVIQETMITSFKSIKKLKNPLCFKSWLIKILINKSNDMYNKRNKYNVISLEDVKDYKNSDYIDIDMVDTILDFNFLCDHFEYEKRIIIMLFYMEKFTDKEIGTILNLNENTVKSKRTRVIQEIKKMIERGEKKTWMI